MYIKFFLYTFLVQALSLLLLPIVIFRPRNMKNFNLYSSVLNFAFKIFTIDMEIENGEYLESDKPYILITNHQSSLDVMVMMKIWPRRNCTILAKKQLLYAGPFSLITWLGGMTFIDRFNSEKARSTINQLAERINEKNMRVWIFPEGTRNATTQLLPFKKGAFHLAIQAKIPVVCVVTSSYLNFYSKKERKFTSNGKVKIRVLKPVETCDLTLDNVTDLAKQMQERMQNAFDLINREIGLDAKYYTKIVKSDDNNNHASTKTTPTNDEDKKKL